MNFNKTLPYLNIGPVRDLAISPLCSATSDLVMEVITHSLLSILNFFYIWQSTQKTNSSPKQKDLDKKLRYNSFQVLLILIPT